MKNQLQMSIPTAEQLVREDLETAERLVFTFARMLGVDGLDRLEAATSALIDARFPDDPGSLLNLRHAKGKQRKRRLGAAFEQARTTVAPTSLESRLNQMLRRGYEELLRSMASTSAIGVAGVRAGHLAMLASEREKLGPEPGWPVDHDREDYPWLFDASLEVEDDAPPAAIEHYLNNRRPFELFDAAVATFESLADAALAWSEQHHADEAAVDRELRRRKTQLEQDLEAERDRFTRTLDTQRRQWAHDIDKLLVEEATKFRQVIVAVQEELRNNEQLNDRLGPILDDLLAFNEKMKAVREGFKDDVNEMRPIDAHMVSAFESWMKERHGQGGARRS